MKKNLLLAAAAFLSGAGAYAQCEAVATLNEDFSEFTITTANAFPQACWTASTGMPLLYTAETEDQSNQYAVYYSGPTQGVSGYLVTPQLSTIDGNYQLSFTTFKLAGPGGAFPAGDMTVQVGTLSDPTIFQDFVPVGEPITVTETAETYSGIVIPVADVDQNFIAFKITGSGQHNAVGIDNIIWDAAPAACEAVATLDEDFNDFTPGLDPIDQNCWTVNGTAPLIYVDGEEGDYYPTFYAASAPNTAGYLVSPEITSIDGTQELSFDAFLIGNPVTATIQVGTLAAADDFASFTAVGEPFALTTEINVIEDIAIPATDHKFIAFKFITDNPHGAGGIDNVVFETPAAGMGENHIAAFGIYPNPAVNKSVTLTTSFNGAEARAAVYSLTGAKVLEAGITSPEQQLDLSTLSAGIYVVKVESGNYTATQKLVVL